ncbi:DUF924 family protein [Coleofasciculus sp.]|uniref:DUF924 family protein n=1 Tax=Coleofasciculus sp. TaxID=3100458 RepID=UPI0039FA8EF9
MTNDEILAFWFGTPDDPAYRKPRQAWFTKNPGFDEEVRSRFLEDYQQAAAGQLNHWQESPHTCLALILLLDQFPRNMFRGQPQAFATDSQALAAAQHAVSQGFDQTLISVQRWFIYMPYEHSENLAHQKKWCFLNNRVPRFDDGCCGGEPHNEPLEST